ncbi:acetolactate synthase [Streptosporangiaceae bacterium NEAU-GS5]|nr:acetolactate synthase [Streptosporangiaceae bacterium NEAU-GS5]
MTGATALVAALAAHGVDTVFGIPGTHNLPIYQALVEAGIRCVTTRHEQGAGYAADGYARVTGRTGVVVTTTGPGVLNAATALAQAYSDSSPVLLISPGVPLAHPRQGRGWLHETKDQSRALDAVCAWSHRVTSTAEIPAAVARAFTRASAAGDCRPRPVHLEIPADLLDAPTGPLKAPSDGPMGGPMGGPVDGPVDGSMGGPMGGPIDGAFGGRPIAVPARTPHRPALEAAARRLRAARRPGIVLGGGSREAGEPALALAERLGAYVVTTANGKATIPESHPLSLGATLHLRAVQEWLVSCDVVLAVGTELAPSDLWVDDFRLTGTLIRVDLDPGQMYGDHVADVALVADAALTLTALAELVDGAGQTAPGDEGHVRTRRDEELVGLMDRWQEPLRAIRAALPTDAIVTADSSMFCYYGALGGLPVDPPGRFLYPTGYGTLGFALPAAIGAKVARPATPVAALTGDGALQFTLQELATAVEVGLPLPVVVCVNDGYGEIRAEMLDRGMPPVAVDLHTPDFVRVAEGFGARGTFVETFADMRTAVEDALRAPVPTVIVFRERP